MRPTGFVAVVGALALVACSSGSGGGAGPVAPRERAAAPTFYPPEPLRFATPLDVQLATSTAGATIRYTTDGTAPTDASPAFADAIPITTTTTIHAIATRAGINASPVASVTYTYRMVNLQVDDDTYTVNGGGLGTTMMFVNRFTPPADDFPFQVRKVSVRLIENHAGEHLRLAVYGDADTDPGNGATLEATYDVTVLENGGTANGGSLGWLRWSVYELSPPVTLRGPGDVLIGYVQVGWEDNFALSSGTFGRSYTAGWHGTVPNPPTLPTDWYVSPFMPPYSAAPYTLAIRGAN